MSRGKGIPTIKFEQVMKNQTQLIKSQSESTPNPYEQKYLKLQQLFVNMRTNKQFNISSIAQENPAKGVYISNNGKIMAAKLYITTQKMQQQQSPKQ